jgi:cyclic pyranopterin phosphate synthase
MPDLPDSQLTHLDSAGKASMVDISDKPVEIREATAQASVELAAETIRAIEQATIAKGDVLAVARVAGIQGAKACSQLIPLCHPLPLSRVAIDFEIVTNESIVIRCTARTLSRTGVEMEALTGVSVAALTIYDMCKGIDKNIRITQTRLLTKSKAPAQPS